MMYSKGQPQTPEMQEQAARCPSTWENRGRMSLAMVSEATKNKTGKGREILRERGKEFPYCTLEILQKGSILNPHTRVFAIILCGSLDTILPATAPDISLCRAACSNIRLPPVHRLRGKYVQDPCPILVGWARWQLIMPVISLIWRQLSCRGKPKIHLTASCLLKLLLEQLHSVYSHLCHLKLAATAIGRIREQGRPTAVPAPPPHASCGMRRRIFSLLCPSATSFISCPKVAIVQIFRHS